MTRSDLAVEYKRSMNCAQAVLAAYADELGLGLETAKRLGAGLGAGMGTMQGTCGALTGAEIVLGLRGDRPAMSRARQLFTEFSKRCHGTICLDLKGVTTGAVLCSCDDCVRNAVDILEEMKA